MNENDLLEIIEHAFGDWFEPADAEVKNSRIKTSLVGLDRAVGAFKKNCNSINYNALCLAMMTYQYWTQKKVIE